MLQEQLTGAIIREGGLALANVLVTRARGSFRPKERTAYRLLDENRYATSGGYNLFTYRRRNRAAFDLFQREVPNGFRPYSAMYTYWCLWALKCRSGDYQVVGSTLAFHVEATGATVLTCLEDVETIGPHATSYLAKGGMDIFRRITQPL